MKTRINPIVVAVTILTLIGCSKDDPTPETEVLLNNDVEASVVYQGVTYPTGWFNYGPTNKFTLSWSSETSSSPSKSLKITTAITDENNFAYWGQSVTTNIPNGKELTLTVKIKGNMVGNGVSIAIRGDDTIMNPGSGEQFSSTEGEQSITGTFDWTDYSVNLNKVDPSIKMITIYLLYLQGTTGDVFFDDVSLKAK